MTVAQAGNTRAVTAAGGRAVATPGATGPSEVAGTLIATGAVAVERRTETIGRPLPGHGAVEGDLRTRGPRQPALG